MWGGGSRETFFGTLRINLNMICVLGLKISATLYDWLVLTHDTCGFCWNKYPGRNFHLCSLEHGEGIIISLHHFALMSSKKENYEHPLEHKVGEVDIVFRISDGIANMARSCVCQHLKILLFKIKFQSPMIEVSFP